MTFNEQILKRKRVYFHGSKTNTLDIKNAHYDCFFISCDITTAIIYCKRTEEEIKYIHTFTIDKPLNIFNARSSVDYFKLHKALLDKGVHETTIKSLTHSLKNNDWSQLENTDITRGFLINVVKSLGYDGFFNFEWDKNLDHFNGQFSKPSIGIFDIKNLNYTGVQSINDFKSLKFTKLYELDVSEAKSVFTSLKKRCRSMDEYNHRVEKCLNDYLEYYTTLTKCELLEIANSVEYEINESMADYYEQRFQEVNCAKAKDVGLKVPPKDWGDYFSKT